MRLITLAAAFVSIAALAPRAQSQPLPHRHDTSRVIEFPDVPGYQTLVVDLHMHTVFSDGSVWPNIRVEEALRDGLDAIATTEHLEYQPHRADIPHPDRNRAFEIAAYRARNTDLIVIPGSEITRSMPPGHANAVFITDANRLLVSDSIEVFREAARQGAFSFWNHPNWTSQRDDGIATLTPTHRYLIDNDLLHGIEVVNELTFSEEALQIALEHDLTIIGTSDIHGLVDWEFNAGHGGHRPVTLVFARERSAESIREALFAGRTAVWFDNTLIGRPENLLPLVNTAITVGNARYDGDTSVLVVEIANPSDVEFVLQNASDFTFHRTPDVFNVAPHATSVLEVKTIERLDRIALPFIVLNAITAPGEHLTFTMTAEVGTN